MLENPQNVALASEVLAIRVWQRLGLALIGTLFFIVDIQVHLHAPNLVHILVLFKTDKLHKSLPLSPLNRKSDFVRFDRYLILLKGSSD